MKVLLVNLILVIFMNISTNAQIDIKFEQYRLENGLTVILHEDHNAPVTAVTVMYHVGSKNEKPKRTGFAHLFEHMMFQGSKHVGDNEHFKLLQEVGANVNGFTTQDGTTYFELLPSNYVELGLYLESDRMGFLLPAMTQDKLDNQRDVVKNERRQNYENRPYGLADEMIAKELYPAWHPYNWPVIGSMDDLSAASLEDVQQFFRTYYAPNNACLVVSGDILPSEVKPLIQKYFGSIPMGERFERPAAVPIALDKQKRITYQDKVQLPRLYLTWHSGALNTREDAVMSVFADILSSGKNSRFYKSLVYDRQIAQSIRASQGGSEISGEFQIVVTPKPDHDLNEMEKAVDEILADLMKTGVTQNEIDKSITNTEVQLVNSVATSLGKGNSLAANYFYTGDASNINKQMDLYKGITPDEVMAVARGILSKPNVVLSIFPLGGVEPPAKKGE